MSLPGQRLQPDRYSLIPRTLTFLLHEGAVLLIKVPEGRGDWAGLFNGIGGHIEKGEDPISSARREIEEETHLIPSSLKLCGFVQVDTKTNPGIGLFVFCGEVDERGPLQASPEGKPEWIQISELANVPLVEDLPQLIPRALASRKAGLPFFARYRYDPSDQLTITFVTE